MAHLVLPTPKEKPKKKSFKLPSIKGRFGVSLVFGAKEIFLGFTATNVDYEPIIPEKRKIDLTKRKVRFFNF